MALQAYFSDYAANDPPTRTVLLSLIKALTIGGRFSKLHFELIYNYIARNPADLLGSLEVIENMICFDKNHVPMFYFSDHNSYIEINPMLTIEKAFSSWFGIAIWFRIEYLNYHQLRNELPLLFSIYSNGSGGFEAFFEENTLYYRVLGSKKYEMDKDEKAEEIFTFETERWYSFFLTHNKKYLASEVRTYVNGEPVKTFNMEYPKMEKVGKLDRGFICK